MRNKERVLERLLFVWVAAAFIGVGAAGPALADDDDDDDDKRGKKVRIFEAFPDAPTPGELTLVGQNFPLPNPRRQSVVCFGEEGLALPHTVVDASEIQASLPPDLVPGSYRVTVFSLRSHRTPVCPQGAAERANVAVFEVAVGAIGPQGDPGPAGPPGISGWEIVRGPTVGGEGRPYRAFADCPPGKKVLGGGGSQGAFGWYLDDSAPKSDGSGWEVQYAPDINGVPGNGIGEAWAICAYVE
ncbi:MAG: hypothetical protein ACYTGQ_08730 [Planctomycetota bacterium]